MGSILSRRPRRVARRSTSIEKATKAAIEMLESRVLLTTYYVSNAGSDAAAGTSQGAAWATVAKVNATAFQPGDQILFQRGGVWQDQLKASSSGTTASPIVYGDYGSGTKPIFSGSDEVASNVFTSIGNSVYTFPLSAVERGEAYWVYLNHTALLAAQGGGINMPINSFYVDGSTIYINTNGVNPSSGVVSVTNRAMGQGADAGIVTSNGKSHLVFNNLIGRETAQVGGGGTVPGLTDAYVFRFMNGTDIKANNIEAYYGGKHHVGAIDVDQFVANGVLASGGVDGVSGNSLPYGNATALVSYADFNVSHITQTWINATVQNYLGSQPAFLTHHDGDNAFDTLTLQNLVSIGSPIALQPGNNLDIIWKGGLVQNNNVVAYGNTTNSLVIDGVTVKGNDSTKLEIYTPNATIQNNVVLNSGQPGGIQVSGANSLVRFNTVVMNGSAVGIRVAGSAAAGSQMYGNIIGGTRNMYDVPSSLPTNYNVFDTSNGTPEFTVGGTGGVSFASRQAAGQETNSVTAVPQFVNPGAGNYAIATTSPAVNRIPSAGITGVPNDIVGVPRPNSGAYDAGAYEALLDNHAPTVATAAAASPSTVIGTTTNLSALGADQEGEISLSYTWSLTGTPPAAVSYSANGTNASKNTTATFAAAGTYNFLVTISDGQYSVTSPVTVTVNQVATAVTVSPATKFVPINTTQQYTAAVRDQFNNPIAGAPITWSITSGGGSINGTGLYTAPGTTGSATIRAASGAFFGQAVATITPPNQAPTIVTAASASPNPVTETTTTLSVLGGDDNGEANLTYSWAVVGTPPAPVVFSGAANGTNAAKTRGATFSANGTYNFQVTITDSNGASTTSNTSVQVFTIVPVTLDGTKDPRYGTATVVQSQQTNNGNSSLGSPAAPYSQLAAGYGIIDTTVDKFYLFIAGSFVAGNSHLDIMIDSKTGQGPANLNGASGVGPWGPMSTMAFDTGFRPDHLFTFGGGAGQYMDYLNLSNNAFASQDFNANPANQVVTATASGVPSFQYRANNAASSSAIAANAGGSVTTGMEFAFDLSDLGYTATDFNNGVPINVAAIISYGSHTQATNQVLAPYTPNPAELAQDGGIYTWYGNGNFNFGNQTRFAGNQYFATTPQPIGGNAPPTIANAAAASPSTVTGTTTALSVLGADDGGESGLAYTWTTTSAPSGAPAVTFSANGTNAAKSSTATFGRAGAYTFQVSVSDGSSSVISTVNVNVNQTATSVLVSPATVSVNTGATQQFTATVRDQFTQTISGAPVTWSMASGGGSVNSSGLYTAPGTTGSASVRATSGAVNGTASVTVTAGNTAPTVATPAAASPSTVTGTTTNLSVLGADNGGEAALTYTWAATTVPSGAPTPTFSANGTNAAKASTATFNRAGAYTFTVTISDGSLTVTSSVNVTVNQTLTSIVLSPGTVSVSNSNTQQFTATGRDQFTQNMTTQPSFTWSVVSGGAGGTVSGTGLYTAPASGTGTSTVRATSSSVQGNATVTVTAVGTNVLSREVWTGITGTSVLGIPLDTAASSTGTLTSFEAPADSGDNYGQRIRGYITPTTTGNYTFWLAGDDTTELYLSTDDQVRNKTRIAYTDWTDPRQWNKYTTQKSAQISLVAGKKYYIEAVGKEGVGGDNLAVSWRLNNTTNPTNGDGSFIIGGSNISPFTGTDGTGLTGTYYNNIDFTGTTVTRVDPTVNFAWGNGSPAAGIDVDTFSVRWTGHVAAVEAGTYYFRVVGDDGIRLYVDGNLIINGWVNQAPTQYTSGPITFAAGERKTITLEYYEDGYDATANLQWLRPGQGSNYTVIPQRQLYTTSDTTNFAGGTVTARGENSGGGEGAVNAFDNTGAKWLDWPGGPSWIQLDYSGSNAYVVTSYTITSGNDAPERDPYNWRLQGSNDGGLTWTTVDTRSAELFTARQQTRTFGVATAGSYQIMRLQIDQTRDPVATNLVQLSEIELFGSQA